MLNYLSVPITVGYNISDNIDLSAGAYVAFGLSGEDKWDYEINDGGLETVQGSEDITFSRDEISGNNSEEVRGLDYGLRISAGYNLNPVQLTLFMENGFANLTPYDPQDPGYDPDTEKVSNFTLGLSIKYILNN